MRMLCPYFDRRFYAPCSTVLAFVCTLAVSGCDEDKAKKDAPKLEDASDDMPVENFAYDEDAEFVLDANAFLNVNTKEDFHIGTIYFEGGTGKNCAKWDIIITGDSLKLARGEGLTAEAQTRLTENEDGTLSGAFETRGTIPGVRFVVKRDSVITFTGAQSYCSSKDRADFSIQENVEKGKLHEIFRGVEVPGIAFMTLKFSDFKNVDSVAKIKEELEAQP